MRNGSLLTVAALLVACGGDSDDAVTGGGDGGGSDLSSRQQAALSVAAANSAVQVAQAGTGGVPDTGERALSGPTPRAVIPEAEQLDCTTLENGEGSIYAYSDASGSQPDTRIHYNGSEVDTTGALDTVMKADPRFSGSLASSGGNFAGTQTRADCEGEVSGRPFLLKGAPDTLIYEGVDGDSDNVVAFNRMGGLADDSLDPVTPPDLSTLNRSDTGTRAIDMRGVIRSCTGCNGDLSAFTGNELDAAVAMFVRMNPPLEGDGMLRIGESESSPFSLVSRAGQPASDQIETELSGRLASTLGDPECHFDVTYETRQPLVQQQGYNAAAGLIAGELAVTVASSGRSHTVTASNGDILVDGEPEDVTDLANDCSFGRSEG